jgi:hypothetical protein
LRTHPAKAQFVKSYYITERNMVYLEQCAKMEDRPDVMEAALENIRVIEDTVAFTRLTMQGRIDKVKARLDASGGMISKTRFSTDGVIYVASSIGIAHFNIIAMLDDYSDLVESLRVNTLSDSDERMEMIAEARRVISEIYVASDMGYNDVSDVYRIGKQMLRKMKNGVYVC